MKRKLESDPPERRILRSAGQTPPVDKDTPPPARNSVDSTKSKPSSADSELRVLRSRRSTETPTHPVFKRPKKPTASDEIKKRPRRGTVSPLERTTTPQKASPKSTIKSPSTPVKQEHSASVPVESPPVKRGRGRPPKIKRGPTPGSSVSPRKLGLKVIKKGALNSSVAERRKSNVSMRSAFSNLVPKSPTNINKGPDNERAIKTEVPSPRKTRALHKKTERGAEFCTLCKQGKGELMQCTNCKLRYHLRKCLLYPDLRAAFVETTTYWQCPKCILCSQCATFVDDPTNVECSRCGRAWHGRCAPPMAKHHGWVCFACCPLNNSSGQSPEKKVTIKTEPLDTSPSPKRKAGRPRKITEQQLPSTSSGSVSGTKLENPNADELALLKERDSLYDRLFDAAKKDQASSPRKLSPSRRSLDKKRSSGATAVDVKPPLASHEIALQQDLDLFESALAEAEAEKDAENQVKKQDGQWVHLGGIHNMKALYTSPMSEQVRNSPDIFVCIFCLLAVPDKHQYRIHVDHCPLRHPPGNEIYRTERISFFEVDGADDKSYCRNLCLLAKLFLSSKILHHEVENFWFYILTEHTERGFEIVAYFSKEKNPSKDYNLSCLLTLPHAQKTGFGRLLIDMSYQLSLLERKVGGPEHPLSDLGLKAYQGYWRAAILAYLRSIRNVNQVTVTEMSLSTRIQRGDIVSQLMRDKLLTYKNGMYYIKSGQRALKFPLCASRLPRIDPNRIVWCPDADVSNLDPSKINGYTVRGDL